MNKLTIITINFNNAEGLKRTIDSIINQTFSDYEWIVVDGGSTDGSKDLLEQYQERFTWWCSEPDKGPYNAMNKGIAHASGEYINFMNSGDVFVDKDILQKIFHLPHTADIIYGQMKVTAWGGKIGNVDVMKPRLSKYDMFFDTFGHQSTFTKRTLFTQVGLFDESYKIAADHKFFAEAIAIHQASYKYLPYVISVYEGDGLSGSYDKIYPEVIRMRQEVYCSDWIHDTDHLYSNMRTIANYDWAMKLFNLLVRIASKLQRTFNRTR